MQTELFDYALPTSFIAQQPVEPRDSSRLLVLHRQDGRIEHRVFRDIGDYLHAGDLLVANNSRVIPARLHGHKSTGGAVEIFLLRQLDETGQQWECLVRGRKLGVGVKVRLEPGEQQTVDGRQQTVDGRQQTVDGRQQTVDGRQQTVDSRQQTVDSRQRM